MVAFRPPDTDDHRRTRASQRRAPKPKGPRPAPRWRPLLAAAHRQLAARPEIPLCLGLLLVAATLTVLREGVLDPIVPYGMFPHYRTIPAKEDVRALRFLGAALAIIGVYYRMLQYKR